MRMDGNAFRVRGHLGEDRVTNVRAWIQRWARCSGIGMILERCIGPRTEILFIRYNEERVFQCTEGDFIALLFQAQVGPAYNMYRCMLKWPYDDFW